MISRMKVKKERDIAVKTNVGFSKGVVVLVSDIN